MPSKKRKYNARFPAGRIKKIMQTDEEVGKVAQAVPIIIFMLTPRTLELFVESLLGKALQVTNGRNAKTLSPSHVKQCILGEARFDFLRDLVKNIPDVSAAEEKELMNELSAESSPTSSRFPDAAPRRIVPEDSNSSSSCEIIRPPQQNQTIAPYTREQLKRALTGDSDKPATSVNVTLDPAPSTSIKIEPAALLKIPSISPVVNVDASTDVPIAMDLSKKEPRPVRTANFYQETLITETVPHSSVIKPNPTYNNSQPSTSFSNLNPVPPLRKIEIAPKTYERSKSLPVAVNTPTTPIINIDFTKNFAKPEIKVLDPTSVPNISKVESKSKFHRQNSRPKIETKRVELKPLPQTIVDIDSLNSGNLQIDEDYDT